MIDDVSLIADVALLVQQRSLSGEEDGAVRLFASLLHRLGFDEVCTDPVGNLVAVIRGGRPGGRVCFEGHIDTVSEGDPALWSRDPFGGEVSAGRIWGRGTSDMKAALVAMAHGLAALVPEKKELHGELVLAAVVCEEIFEGVAFGHLLDACPVDVVVVGEATELELAVGQKGRAEIRLEVHGKSAHSSCPSAGLNAVRGFASIFSSIDQISLPHDPLLGPAILEPVDVISSPWPGASVIPALCSSTWDRRVLPGEREEDVIAPLRALLERQMGAFPGISAQAGIVEAEFKTWTGKTLKARRFFPAWVLSAEDPFRAVAQAALAAAGLPAGIRTWGFCTDGSESAGRRGIPTLGFGPSREDCAHIADEYVEVSQVLAAARGYTALARALSGHVARQGTAGR